MAKFVICYFFSTVVIMVTLEIQQYLVVNVSLVNVRVRDHAIEAQGNAWTVVVIRKVGVAKNAKQIITVTQLLPTASHVIAIK